MNNLDAILAEARQDGVEVKQYCSFNCTRASAGEFTVVENGFEIVLPVCNECAQEFIAKRNQKGLDTLTDK